MTRSKRPPASSMGAEASGSPSPEPARRRPCFGTAPPTALHFFDDILEFLRGDAGLLIAALAALTLEGDTSEFTGLRGAFDDLLEHMDDIIGNAPVNRGVLADTTLDARIRSAVCAARRTSRLVVPTKSGRR